jgi:hypothetical protein
VYVSLPTFLSLLDVRLAVFLLAAREPGLSSFFHIACKIIFGFAMIRHFTFQGVLGWTSSRRVTGALKGPGPASLNGAVHAQCLRRRT